MYQMRKLSVIIMTWRKWPRSLNNYRVTEMNSNVTKCRELQLPIPLKD